MNEILDPQDSNYELAFISTQEIFEERPELD